jgi:hypothetical protein
MNNRLRWLGLLLATTSLVNAAPAVNCETPTPTPPPPPSEEECAAATQDEAARQAICDRYYNACVNDVCNSSAMGMNICCNGEVIPCVWDENRRKSNLENGCAGGGPPNLVGVPDESGCCAGDNIYMDCIRAHEDFHVLQSETAIPCQPGDWSPSMSAPGYECLSECEALARELQCLQTAQASRRCERQDNCGRPDQALECGMRIYSAISDLEARIDQECTAECMAVPTPTPTPQPTPTAKESPCP